MKVQILGAAFTLTSSLKKSDMEKLQKYQPEALRIVDPETKDTVYGIGTSKCAAIGNVGISFNSADADGFAQATFPVPENVTDRSKWVEEQFGLAIFRLGEVEEAAAGQLTNLNGKFDKVGKAIKVMG